MSCVRYAWTLLQNPTRDFFGWHISCASSFRNNSTLLCCNREFCCKKRILCLFAMGQMLLFEILFHMVVNASWSAGSWSSTELLSPISAHDIDEIFSPDEMWAKNCIQRSIAYLLCYWFWDFCRVKLSGIVELRTPERWDSDINLMESMQLSQFDG